MIQNIQSVVLKMEKKLGGLEKEVADIHRKISSQSEQEVKSSLNVKETSEDSQSPLMNDDLLTSVSQLSQYAKKTDKKMDELKVKMDRMEKVNVSLTDKVTRMMLVNCHTNVAMKEDIDVKTLVQTSKLNNLFKEQTKSFKRDIMLKDEVQDNFDKVNSVITSVKENLGEHFLILSKTWIQI